MYSEYSISLTTNQKKKIADALNKKSGVTIRLNPSQFSGTDKLMLTNRQVTKINKHKKLNKGLDLTLSKAQMSKMGGFWPMLLAGLAGSILPNLLGGKGFKKKTARGLVLPGTTARGLTLPGSH